MLPEEPSGDVYGDTQFARKHIKMLNMKIHQYIEDIKKMQTVEKADKDEIVRLREILESCTSSGGEVYRLKFNENVHIATIDRLQRELKEAQRKSSQFEDLYTIYVTEASRLKAKYDALEHTFNEEVHRRC